MWNMRAELSIRCHHFRGARGTAIITDPVLTNVKTPEINVSDVIEKYGNGAREICISYKLRGSANPLGA
jgi:hypothetical protein